MLKRFLGFFGFLMEFLVLSGIPAVAQEVVAPRINVKVDLVQLNVAVTDNKGNYITGLRPEEFVITEDGISENIALFGARRRIRPRASERDAVRSQARQISRRPPTNPWCICVRE